MAFLEDDVIEQFTSDFKVIDLFFKKWLGELDSLGGDKHMIRQQKLVTNGKIKIEDAAVEMEVSIAKMKEIFAKSAERHYFGIKG